MKGGFVGGSGLVWCCAGYPTHAADITMPGQPPPAPPAAITAPAPAYNWYGFFIGGHLGHGWGSGGVELTPDSNYTGTFGGAAFPTVIAADPKGWEGGIQYGSNWQFEHIVLGTESDFSFTGIDRSQTIITNVTVPIANTGEQRLPWLGTTRVRGGYVVQDNILLYGTAGLANGRAETSFSALESPGACPGSPCARASEKKNLWGWTVGGGAEYGAGPWSAKIEFLHYDLGTLTIHTVDPTMKGSIAAATKFAGNIVRAGVNDRFNWTPWELIFGR